MWEFFGGEIVLNEKVNKIPIDKIRKQNKVTIADEIEHTSTYHFEPPLKPEQLFSCFLDPSEILFTKQNIWLLYIEKQFKIRIPAGAVEILLPYLKSALESGLMRLEKGDRNDWKGAKRKVQRKFNLTKLDFNTMAEKTNELTIGSLQPLYDENAHANRVRNVLRAIRLHIPNFKWSMPDCRTNASCPIGLENALRKLAEETHGK